MRPPALRSLFGIVAALLVALGPALPASAGPEGARDRKGPPGAGRDRRQREELLPPAERLARLKKIAEGEVRITGKYARLFAEEKEPLVAAAGGVKVQGSDFRLAARNLVIWVDPEKLKELEERGFDADEVAPDVPEGAEAEPDDAAAGGAIYRRDLFTAIYADGDVTFSQGSELVRCSQLYWDLRQERALMIEGEIRTWVGVRESRVPLTARAQEIRQTAPGTFKAKHAALTNCTYGRPHWHLDVADLELSDREDGDVDFAASNVTVRSGSLPVLWFPYASGTAGTGNSIYFRGARAGHSSRFGYFVFSDWGDEIRLPGEKKKWGDWIVHVDPSEVHGLGLGFDLEYKTTEYRGFLWTYYINDEADEDRDGTPIEDEDRGRVRLAHRQFLSESVTLDLEANYLSDPNFLNEYFEKEFKEDKAPDTAAYLKWQEGNEAATFLARTRLNDFLERTQYLPQATYRLFSEPILPGGTDSRLGTNVYYSLDAQVARANFRGDDTDPNHFDSEDVNRFDSIHRLAVPFDVSAVRLNPFAEGRVSAWSQDVEEDGDPIERFTATAGASAAMQFSRVYDANSKLLRVDGLRHIATPAVRYSNTFENTADPDELVQLDNVEQQVQRETVRLALVNRLQTRDAVDKATPFTIVDLDTYIDWFPDPDRDNEIPDDDGELHSYPWSNLTNDLRINVSRRILILSRSEYSFLRDDFERGDVGLRAVASDELRFFVGYNATKGLQSVATLDIDYRLSEKWGLELLERYDFREDESQETSLLVKRFVHDWVFEFEFSHDDGDGDTSITVALVPRQLYRSRALKGFRAGDQPEYGGGDFVY